MTTRNRTLVYMKYRDALKTVRPPSSSSPGSRGSAGGQVIEMVGSSILNQSRSYARLRTDDPGYSSTEGAIAVGLPPTWVDFSKEVVANTDRARMKIAELGRAHAKALMPSFGDGKEEQRLIESLTQEITDLIKLSEKNLHRLSRGGPSEDSILRKNVQRCLATDLQGLSVELRKKQSAYLKRLKQLKERCLATDLQGLSVELRKKQSAYLKRLKQLKEGQDGVDFEMNLKDSRSRMDEDEFDDMGFSEHQMAKLEKSEAITAEREREIQQVVESVNELAEIMKDLSFLVIDQGTIIDRIDYNIQNVASTVEKGLQQLQKAERSQKEGGMVMCATTLVIMCCVMLVLLILKEIFL